MAQQLTRLDFRIERGSKKAIAQAASLCGQTLSDFAKTALADKASEVIQRHRVTLLTDEEWARFMKIVDSDAEPNQKLKTAAKRFREQRG